MSESPFGPADVAQLREREIPVGEGLRQLDLLRRPPAPRRLVRPCTIGDGIERVPEAEIAGLVARHDAAARSGRLVKFVPASGVASRMFQDVAGFGRPAAERAEAATRALLREASRLPFAEELEAALARRGARLDRIVGDGALAEFLDVLLRPGGLGYAEVPKGLLPFHRYPDRARTPFEEHLVEAAATIRAEGGTCRLHFTVSGGHVAGFRSLLERVRARYESSLDARFDVEFSVQKEATDTLAARLDGTPARDGAGRLIFRPSGHGALIENLDDLEGDLVLIKNIDNVQPDRLRSATLLWKKVLAGRLLEVQERVFEYVERLESGPAGSPLLDEVAAFARDRLHLPAPPATGPPATRQGLLLSALERPIRVCGVVRNTGEPGGGPFWIRGPGGTESIQIVESAEIDRGSPDQEGIVAAATHFNPVDLACGVRDARGAAFDLNRFVDPDAVIVTRKSWEGIEILALERPGLWNGAMARWITLLVEVPLATFTPVKTVFDLLRPEHQPA